MKRLVILLMGIVISFSSGSFMCAREVDEFKDMEQYRHAPNYYSKEYQQRIKETEVRISNRNKTIRVSERQELAINGYEQETNYYCGPASVQIVLKYKTGTKYSQNSLANDMGTAQGVGTYVYKITERLNKELGANTYQHVLLSASNKNSINSSIQDSIDGDCPLIFHTNTAYLEGYGHSSGHYVVGCGYIYGMSGGTSGNIIKYFDPYRSTNSADGDTYGYHQLSTNSMADAVINRAGYYIRKS